MGVTAITQIAATVSNIIFFLVFVVAYYKMIKMNRRTLRLQEWQATAVGRPQVIVDDYSRLPEVDISIRNINEGAVLTFLKEKGLEHGIKVTTRYKDLAGESYETEWNLNPSIYRDGNYIQRKGVGDLVNATREISAKMDGVSVSQKHSKS